MAWLIEAFLIEENDNEKAIEDHKQEIKYIDKTARERIAKINKDARERIEDDPDKKKTINTIRRLKVNTINKNAELAKKKHKEAIDKLNKAKEGDEE